MAASVGRALTAKAPPGSVTITLVSPSGHPATAAGGHPTMTDAGLQGACHMTVRVERDGPVTTVIMDRPGVRNAVDGPAAAALAGAFRAFDADDGAHVAVLWGAGGTFCSGADL